jgi:hypothetical protein
MRPFHSSFSRRDFLRGIGLSGAVFAIGSGFPDYAVADNKSRKLGVALLGLGRYSANQLGQILELKHIKGAIRVTENIPPRPKAFNTIVYTKATPNCLATCLQPTF